MGVGIFFYAVTEAEVAMIEGLGQNADNDDLYGLLEVLPQADCSHFQLPQDLERLWNAPLADILEDEIYNDEISDRIVRVSPTFARQVADSPEAQRELRFLCQLALDQHKVVLLQVVG
jgi:hypothetical protein